MINIDDKQSRNPSLLAPLGPQTSWDPLETTWKPLGTTWRPPGGPLEAPWTPLEAPWRPLGALWEASETLLEPPSAPLALPELIWELLRTAFERSWTPPEGQKATQRAPKRLPRGPRSD